MLPGMHTIKLVSVFISPLQMLDRNPPPWFYLIENLLSRQKHHDQGRRVIKLVPVVTRSLSRAEFGQVESGLFRSGPSVAASSRCEAETEAAMLSAWY